MSNRVRYNVFDLSRRRLIVLTTSTILFGFGIWFLNNVVPYKGIWDQFSAASTVNNFFCERTIIEGIVRQPFNTFSNFIYWITGFAIVRRGWRDQSTRREYNIISVNPFYSILYGGILIYTFIASTFFHSSLIHFASRIDFSAVFSLSLFPLMYFTHRVWLLAIGLPSNAKHTKSSRTLIVVFTGLYIFLTSTVEGTTANYVVLAIIFLSIIFAMIVERKDPGKANNRYLLISIITILCGVVCFDLDVRKIFCDPTSVIQPHSLWHLFSGISTFYFYMYIRSEKNDLRSPGGSLVG